MSLHQRDGREGVPPGFLDLPARVYAGDDSWVPEDGDAVAAAFSPENPYFAYGQAQALCIPGKVRVAAFHEPAFRIHDEKVAFFGYFESTGDGAANAEAFAALRGWARARGARALYGPIQWNTYRGYRVRLSAEPGALPFLGEPHSHPAYPGQFEALGMALHQRSLTQIIPLKQVVEGLALVAPVYEGLCGQGYRFETPTPERWAASLPTLYEMAESIFAQNFAYSRISYPEFCGVFEAALLRRICPHSSTLVFGPDGDPVAFGLAFPHYGPLIVSGRGAERVPVRDLDYQRHLPLLAEQRPRACIGKTIGVQRAHRRKGLMEAMLYASFQRAQRLYDVWYGALIREDNFSRRVFDAVKVGERWYGLYKMTLEDS